MPRLALLAQQPPHLGRPQGPDRREVAVVEDAVAHFRADDAVGVPEGHCPLVVYARVGPRVACTPGRSPGLHKLSRQAGGRAGSVRAAAAPAQCAAAAAARRRNHRLPG